MKSSLSGIMKGKILMNILLIKNVYIEESTSPQSASLQVKKR